MHIIRQGIILYEGPSQIDQQPVVAIATGLINPSPNRKTGPMVQVYMMRSDQHPLQALHTGNDVSVCGNCQHRGEVVVGDDGKRRMTERSCYVTMIHGPSSVYRTYQSGGYERVSPLMARKILTGRLVRIGSYGDPAAVPLPVWDTVLAKVNDLTAYTHLWRNFPDLKTFCMASCDTPEEREEAKAVGFRTYRVRPPGADVLDGEGQCPASSEMGHAVQCIQCMLCGGLRTKAKADLTIEAHGTGHAHYVRRSAE